MRRLFGPNRQEILYRMLVYRNQSRLKPIQQTSFLKIEKKSSKDSWSYYSMNWALENSIPTVDPSCKIGELYLKTTIIYSHHKNNYARSFSIFSSSSCLKKFNFDKI